jgi:hypothetical protein
LQAIVFAVIFGDHLQTSRGTIPPLLPVNKENIFKIIFLFYKNAFS